MSDIPRLVVVSNSLYDEIQRRLDAAFVQCPAAAKDRDALYHQLLDAFDKYGVIPEFTIVKKDDAP